MARQAVRTAPEAQGVVIDAQTGEVTPYDRAPSNVPTLMEFGGTEETQANYKIVKHVAVPMLSLKEAPPGRAIICKFVDACRIAPKLEGYKSAIPGDMYFSTVEARNGTARMLPWTQVFKTEMEKSYPNGSYVGKWFQVTRMPMKEGKRYWTFAIAEVEFTQAA
jgi:hypothetical protein